MKGRLYTLLVIGTVLFNSSIAIGIVDRGANIINIKNFNKYYNQSTQIHSKNYFNNNSELIDEFTWSVMRYDHLSESENFGIVNMPKPSPGVILVPTNMICINVCNVAISIYHENKMDTLKALEKYDLNHMVVGLPFIFWRMWANKNSMPCYGQKSSAQEMQSLADRLFWTDLVGDCYSQAVFNTALLRLCGFSPEEVFTLVMPMHAVVIVKVEEQWYVFDSVQAQFSKKAIMKSYKMPAEEIIYWIENDKYFINFGTPYPEIFPYQNNPYSNIDSNIIIDIVENIVPIFKNSTLGGQDWEIHDFIENATPCPDMITVEVANNVEDAQGSTNEEKARSLLELNKAFIKEQTGGDIPNQYDRSLYALGSLSVEYPQAYANAARYATWTSWFSKRLDSRFPTFDYLKMIFWIKLIIGLQQTMEEECISFSDFSYLRQSGSSLDQAIVAYGTLRNMKKNDNYWQPEDLYVLLTEDLKGYLAIKASNCWIYINFGKGKIINTNPPENIFKVFNEIECTSTWENNEIL